MDIINFADISKKYLKIFIEYLYSERSSSANTVNAYEKDLTNYFAFCNNIFLASDEAFLGHNIYIKCISDIFSNNIINIYLKHLTNKNFSISSISRKISVLKHFLKFSKNEKIIDNDVNLSLIAPRKKSLLPKALSINQLDILLEAADNGDNQSTKMRNIFIIELLYSTGMRISEMIKIKLGDIKREINDKMDNIGNKEGEILPFLNVIGKGKKERIVFLNEKCIKAFRMYLPHRLSALKIADKVHENFLLGQDKKEQWLFPTLTKNKKMTHISRQRVDQIIKKLAVSAGMNRNQISSHKIRHSFATHMLANGADLLFIKKILGHSDISSTEIYTKLANDELMHFMLQKHPLSSIKTKN